MSGENQAKGQSPVEASSQVIRRFFDLIERFEGRKPGIETKSAPRIQSNSRPHARIRRVDGARS